MFPTDDPTAHPLTETVSLLRRRWKLIVGVTVLIVVGVVGFGELTEREADATFDATHALGTNPNRTTNAPLTLSQTATVLTAPNSDLAAEAESRLGPTDDTTVEAVADPVESTLKIRARGSDADRVVEVADTYAQVLLDTFGGDDRVVFQEQVQILQTQVDQASAELSAAENVVAINPLDPRAAAERDSALNAYRVAIDGLSAVQAAGIPAPTFITLTSASADEATIGGFTGLGAPRRAAAALVLGLMLGVGLAFLREALDRRLKSSAAAAEAFGVPVLSEIPDAGKALSAGLAPIGSVVTEAYRRIRTILELERKTLESTEGGATVVMVVSPGPGEGKTTSIAHLARSLGEVGNRTLAISADFRRPRLHHLLGVDPEEGLAALAGPQTNGTRNLVQKCDLDNVSVITAGKGTHDPTVLISITRKLIAEARRSFDYILIDTSPILSTSDALDLASSVDIVLAVAKFRSTGRPAAERTRDMLIQTAAPLLGVIVTGVNARDTYGSYYYYYHPDSAPPPEPRRGRREANDGV